MGRRRKPMPEKNVRKLEERSQGMCEAGCGKRANEIHHRRFLGRGGDHNLANLVALCNPNGGGNAGSGCHGRAHGNGKHPAPEGWAISQYDRRTEAGVPFVDLGGVTWWLDDDGGKETDDFREVSG